MSNFKIGDRVRRIKDNNLLGGATIYKGDEGIIVEISGAAGYEVQITKGLNKGKIAYCNRS